MFTIVYIVGPRQTGKTTLVQSLAQEKGYNYLTLDKQTVDRRIDADPDGYISGLDRAVIDEVQQRPDLLRIIKYNVDERAGNGYFILTGSVALKAQPKVTDLLPGRMCVLKLLPLSQAELSETATNFITNVFKKNLDEWVCEPQNAEQLQRAIVRGGYPALLKLKARSSRVTWMRQYIDLISKRDIPSLRGQKERVELKRLLTILANASGGRLNISKIASKLNQAPGSAKRYVKLAEDLYLIQRLPAFDPAQNEFEPRKQSKLLFNDSGFLSALLGVTEVSQDKYLKHAGRLLETFVYSEIAKHSNALDDGHEIGYWADKRHEVDLIIRHNEQFVGIEVKHTTAVSARDFAGLQRVAKQLGKRMVRGIVLCRCEQIINFVKLSSETGVPMQAMPISALWAEKHP